MTVPSMDAYQCDSCGACCRTFPVFASGADAEREPRVRAEGRELAGWLATPAWRYQLHPLPFQQTCCFLEADSRCDIYPTRPQVCRDFAAGSPQCQEARARVGLGMLPPTPDTTG